MIEAEGDGVAELLKSLPTLLGGGQAEATVDTPIVTAPAPAALPAREDDRPQPAKTFPRKKSRFLISSDKWAGELAPAAAERAVGRQPGSFGVAISAARKAGRTHFGDRAGNRYTFRETTAASSDSSGSAGTVGAVDSVQA